MLLRRTTHRLPVLALLAGLAACSGSNDDPTDPGGGGGGGGGDDGVVTIGLSGTSFSPSSVSISVGTTVRWRNNEGVHTATPDGHSEWQSWSTNSSGQTFEHTFNTAGTYAYFCAPHQSQGMTGTIQVQ